MMAGPYADNYEHLRDELRRLDARIRLRTLTWPLLNEAAPQSQLERTVFISPDEVTWLLDRGPEPGPDSPAAAAARGILDELGETIGGRTAASRDAGVDLALPRLAELFGLSDVELQAIVVCLAPELRSKYDRLYAYLQDDITRKRPSVDLVLDLLCGTEDRRWTAQRIFGETAALQHWGLLQEVADPNSPSGSSGLARFLRLDPRICRFALGDQRIDGRLARVARLRRPPPTEPAADPAAAVAVEGLRLDPDPSADCRQVLYLQGPEGVGKAEQALRLSAAAGLALLILDAEALPALPPDQAQDLLVAACRESALQRSALYLERADALLGAPGRAVLKSLGRLAAERGGPIILGGEVPWRANGIFDPAHFGTAAVPVPGAAERAALWRRQLDGKAPAAADWAEDLACRFVLTPARIRQAAAAAEEQSRRLSAASGPSLEEFAAACRHQSSQQLGDLAVKVDPRHGWEDLVLPDSRTAQLREICAQVHQHYRVYEAWGFGRELSRGKGLSVLFAGPPGTGKTLAAEVLAREAGLGLFEVDLSGVVSKYIGETEKNLARIFDEARTGNAILFFDEADALFGKRTEVRDAHDRYANIETSFLLQKLDEHEGIVLLASNLRSNLDEAFTRRLRYVVDFPFPDAALRRRIWESHLPAEAPVADDVDCGALAGEYAIAGGSIKNIVLNAAFLAAADGGIITARHIRLGTRREFEKLGKLWTEQPAPTEVAP
ncbi:ATP-binding protein [Arthrobacter sp. I2-34]|uniref:ATP-binding protein n=1 Tax=Arthrobacter hankyongi TaxID=2904801 RepID=A0ABS9L6Y7_9MICC|nr:ATP-binding protein [Arthrobacter hankyongi]MCG2622429.1 ATP-binding protein [Arthrobacter hankyongi]